MSLTTEQVAQVAELKAKYPFFKADEYIAMYPDLVKGGVTAESAILHFEQFGRFEYRAPNVEFNGRINPENLTAYAVANPDVLEALGLDVDATEFTDEELGLVLANYWEFFDANQDRPANLADAEIRNPVDLDPVDPVDPELGDLEAALVAYQETETDLAATVKAAAEKLGVENNADAIETAKDDAAEALATGFGAELGAGFANASTPLQLSALATAQANLRSKVEVEKANLEPAEQSAVIKFAKAKAELNAAAEKMADANINASAQVDTALVQNGLITGIAFNAFASGTPATAANLLFATTGVSVTTGVIVTISAKGDVVFMDAVSPATTPPTPSTNPADPADIAIIKGLKGYSDLIASLTAVDTAGKNSDKAVDALFTATDKLNELEAGTIMDMSSASATVPAFALTSAYADTLKDDIKEATAATFAAAAADIEAVDFDTIGSPSATPAVPPSALAVKAKDLADAQADLSKFDIQSKAFKDAAEEVIKVEAAQADTKAALKVLKEDFDVNPIIVEGKDAQVVGSNEDDLFVYTDTANNAEVDFFNETGDDLFFFGSQFTLVELAAGDEMGKGDLGSKDVLELFAQQDGDNVVLYVELDEVGGTALGLDNVNKITLTGVNLEDLDFQGGFLGMKAAEVVA